MRDTSGNDSIPDRNNTSTTTDAAYDVLHDPQTATHYEHLRDPYESLHLQQTSRETHVIVPEIKEADYANVNNTYEEILE